MTHTFSERNWLHDNAWAHNTALGWICAGGGAVVGFLLVRAALRAIAHRLRARNAARRSPALDTMVAMFDAVRSWLLAVLAALIAADFLTFGSRTEYWLHLATFAAVGVQIVLCINRAIVAWLRRSTLTEQGTRGDVPVMLGILTWVAQFVVWVTFLLALLTNAGVDITAFIASLGIGGIAVALALQNILGDLFASVAIGLDKPFEVGEFIAFGSDMGTVTHVGVKTTRVQSLSGEQLAIANSKLLALLIHNYDRLAERRIVFGFRLPYTTTREQALQVVAEVNDIIGAADATRLDRGHFVGFGDYGLNFEFVYYVLDPSYTVYRDIQQAINTEIMAALERLGLHFSVPTGTLPVPGGDSGA